MTATPHHDARGVSRLLEHYGRIAQLGDGRPSARDRLETALGGELARRLVGALAGDHRLPARAFGD